MLAMHFDRLGADVAQQRGGDAGGAGESAAAAVGFQRAAQDQRLARLMLDPLLGQYRQRRMAGGQFDLGADARRRLAAADQPGVGAITQRQAERIEEDGLAGAGLAG